jgi:transposase
MSGVTTTLKVAHVRLCHSRMMFVRAYPRETQEMVFDAHDWAFALFKGACTRGIYDNMKTAVDTQSSSARIGNTIAASCKCVGTISSTSRLHTGVRLGERPSGEPARSCS